MTPLTQPLTKPLSVPRVREAGAIPTPPIAHLHEPLVRPLPGQGPGVWHGAGAGHVPVR